MKKMNFLLGVACGLAVGWFFAPEKGAELRKKMSKARHEGKLGLAPLKREAQQTFQDVAATAKEVASSARDFINDEVDMVKRLYQSYQPAKGAATPKKAASKSVSTKSISKTPTKRKAAPQKSASKQKTKDSK